MSFEANISYNISSVYNQFLSCHYLGVLKISYLTRTRYAHFLVPYLCSWTWIALHNSQLKYNLYWARLIFCLKRAVFPLPLRKLSSDYKRFEHQVGGAWILTSRGVWLRWLQQGYPLALTWCRTKSRKSEREHFFVTSWLIILSDATKFY